MHCLGCGAKVPANQEAKRRHDRAGGTCDLVRGQSGSESGMTEPTVYIVDDDTSFLLAIARLLRANGFRVETYASATAFLDQRRADEPGCVIVDLRMPE